MREGAGATPLSVLIVNLPPAVGSEELLSDYYAIPVPPRIYWVAAGYGLIHRIYLVRNRSALGV